MTTYVIKNSSDHVLRIETGSLAPEPLEGEFVATTAQAFPGFPSEEGKVVVHTASPDAFSILDIRDLAAIKTAKNLEINEARLAANRTSFQYGGKDIACDLLSRSDIDAVNGIVSLTGALPINFPGAWKAIDNTYVIISSRETWISFYGAMVNKGTDNFTYSQELKSRLQAATTASEVEAIIWENE